MNREAIANEGSHATWWTEIVWRVYGAINLQRYLFPLALKRIQVALGPKVHSWGWFFARFFHL